MRLRVQLFLFCRVISGLFVLELIAVFCIRFLGDFLFQKFDISVFYPQKSVIGKSDQLLGFYGKFVPFFFLIFAS